LHLLRNLASGWIPVGLDELGGWASYARFSHTLLWLVKLDAPKDVRVSAAVGTAPCTVGYYVWPGKCRNGKGGGLKIAFHLAPATLRFSELGIIEKAASALSGGAWRKFPGFGLTRPPNHVKIVTCGRERHRRR
jgi:hypothetical protein